jgi:hypothetical protein
MSILKTNTTRRYKTRSRVQKLVKTINIIRLNDIYEEFELDKQFGDFEEIYKRLGRDWELPTGLHCPQDLIEHLKECNGLGEWKKVREALIYYIEFCYRVNPVNDFNNIFLELWVP